MNAKKYGRPYKLEGLKFGNWTVIEKSSSIGDKNSVWLCLCGCGNKRRVIGQTLVEGISRSCGCEGWAKTRGLKTQFCIYKDAAKKRRKKFSLPYNRFCKLVLQDCYYCGSPPFIKKQNKGPRRGKNRVYFMAMNGIDRKDSKIGYTNKNCVPCCSVCNYMKHVLSEEEFLAHIKKITNHQKRKK